MPGTRARASVGRHRHQPPPAAALCVHVRACMHVRECMRACIARSATPARRPHHPPSAAHQAISISGAEWHRQRTRAAPAAAAAARPGPAYCRRCCELVFGTRACVRACVFRWWGGACRWCASGRVATAGWWLAGGGGGDGPSVGGGIGSDGRPP